MKHFLRALSHRNYRLYFFGQSVSLIGTWMQQVAMSWLVYKWHDNTRELSVVLFCGQVPALFLSPLAGVLADRWNRHRLLLLTQSLAMIQAFLLAALVTTNLINLVSIALLSLFLGLINTFDMTARQAFLTDMVTTREDLGNAIALNSSIVNGTRLLGPTLAGLLLAATNAGVCFFLNGLSYLAVLLALLAMRLPPPRPRQPTPLLRGLHEGLWYVIGFAPIRSILLLLSGASIAATSYSVLLPAFTVKVLRGDARVLGFLSAASGVGALSGALFLASRRSVLGLGRWIMQAMALLGLGLLGLALTRHLALAMLALVVVGFGMMVQMASSNTLLQTIVDEDKRGRVMSFYTMAFLGTAPLGTLLTGALDGIFSNLLPNTVHPARGTLATLAVSGAACILGALLFAMQLPRLRELIRPIYVRLRILPPPELAAGLENATELSLTTKE